MIESLFIANRGEIAVRVARSCRALGVESVVAFTEPDADSLAVRTCDRAVRVPSYLERAALVQAASQAGCDAVHPGFGFLAEDAAFAQAVIDAGLTWVGPSPAAIAAMGSKAAARQRMAGSGVPVIPGYDGAEQSDAALVDAAAAVGFPVLVKASAGGGGKGMQVVHSAADLPSALGAARRLAASAFGDPRLIVERYLTRPRHVEVQILADQHGATVALWERECSVQRRHQKVLEESPSPALAGPDGPARRAVLHAHAVRAARSVAYVGAGTVELILDESGEAWFLEMNTRLQVEHPVTEAVSGLDLVALQLAVAEGAHLADLLPDWVQAAVGLDAEDRAEVPPPRGWAVEARLYAEDPDDDYRPCTGVVHAWQPPTGVRVDSGVAARSRVTPDYDPMLAKIIAHGPTRAVALRRLDRALAELVCLGVGTNRGWLRRVLALPAVQSGALHTGLLAEAAAELAPPQAELDRAGIAVVVHEVLHHHHPALTGLVRGWRTHRSRDTRVRLAHGEQTWDVAWRDLGDGRLQLDEHAVRVCGTQPLRLELDGVVSTVAVASQGAWRWVHLPAADVALAVVDELAPPEVALPAGSCTAPMPGRVVRVAVAPGDQVCEGDPLLVIEAMKMEQSLRAPAAGTVTAVHAAAGDQVEAGQVLVVLTGP